MDNDLSNYRKAYQREALSEDKIPENPIELFRDWFFEVNEADTDDEANAVTLSTIGLDGYPKGRVVLLKRFDHEGFVFYTNYNLSLIHI